MPGCPIPGKADRQRAGGRAAPASNPATAAEAASAGVPSGIVIEAVMNSFSTDGANWKPVQPSSTTVEHEAAAEQQGEQSDGRRDVTPAPDERQPPVAYSIDSASARIAGCCLSN